MAEGIIDPMPGWLSFKEQFIKHFMLHDENEMARDNLDLLNMKDKTCEEYTSIFNGYTEIAQYDDVYLLRKYREGLSKPLHNKVISTYPSPETIEDWKERAMNLDRAWRKTLKKNAKTKSRPYVPYKKPEQKRDPNAMDIDQMSVEEKEDLMKERACFFCKQSGHRAFECPQKGRNPARNQKKPWVTPQATAPTQRRNINFARTEEKRDGAEDAYDNVQKALSSLSEEEYKNFQDISSRRGGF
jgi:hypothetical protein